MKEIEDCFSISTLQLYQKENPFKIILLLITFKLCHHLLRVEIGFLQLMLWFENWFLVSTLPLIS